MKVRNALTVLGTVVLAACSVSSARATLTYGDTLYIDFGRSDTTNGIIMPAAATVDASAGNSTGVADSFGLYWNNAIMNTANAGGNQPPTVTNLIDSANVGTGINLSFDSKWQSNGFNNGGLLTPSSTLLGNIANKNATGDYYFYNASDSGTAGATMTFSNLDLSLSYNFQIFATRLQTSSTDVRNTMYSITDANGTHTFTLQTTGLGIGDGGYNGNNNTFANLNNIVPDSSGQITLKVINATSANTFAYIGTLQLTAVPEPSSVCLLALAGAALVVIHCRRRAA